MTALGGILIVFGLVNLGLTIKDGMQGGGGQLSGALAMIIGGAIVVGAAVYFKEHMKILGRIKKSKVLTAVMTAVLPRDISPIRRFTPQMFPARIANPRL